MRPETAAARALERVPATSSRPAVAPVFLASVYTFAGLEQLERVYAGAEPGYVYSRQGNPNVAALEEAVAALEGAETAVAAASGLGAVLAVVLTLAGTGDTVVAAADLYGGTVRLLAHELARLGIRTRFVPAGDPAAVRRALEEPGVRLLLVETVTNPLCRLVDVPALAALARAAGVPLVVDNTFLSPVLFRPLDHGATVVVHSGSKFLGGHADVIAGVAAGPADLMRAVRERVAALGLPLEPFSAWLLLRGLATLFLRVRRQAANAAALASFLAAHPAVDRVYYAGLPEDPQHALARRLLPEGPGPMLAFALRGGGRAAARFLAALRLVRLAPSLGDVMTSVSHPASTSHRHLEAAERRRRGIHGGVIRVSTGIEDVADLQEDFARALDAARPAARPHTRGRRA